MISSNNQSPEKLLPLNSETVQSVVEHMNSDHADSCLSIVRAFSEHGAAATQALLIDMDREGLLFVIQTHEEHESVNNQKVRVRFSKPLRTEAQIRGALVGLTRQARQEQAE